MTHVNVREVLESLTLAKEAYDAVPDLRRQIDDLQAALAQRDRTVTSLQSDLAQTISGKANVEAKLKQTEEERDAYGFRAIDAEEKLEKVFGVVKPATPAPSTPEVSQSAADPTVSVTDSDGSSSQTAHSVETPVTAEVRKPSDPTISEPVGSTSPVPEDKEPVGPTSTTTGTTEPIGVTEPVINPTQDWGQSASHPTAQTASVQSGVNTSDVAKSSDQSFTTQSDHGDESHAVIDKPYLGHPSWEKPHDMSWNEWEAKGGTVPGWMKSAH